MIFHFAGINRCFFCVGHFQKFLKNYLAHRFVINSYVNVNLHLMLFQLWCNLQVYVRTKNTKTQCATANMTTDAVDNLLPNINHDSLVCPIWKQPYPPIGQFLTIQWEETVDDFTPMVIFFDIR